MEKKHAAQPFLKVLSGYIACFILLCLWGKYFMSGSDAFGYGLFAIWLLHPLFSAAFSFRACLITKKLFLIFPPLSFILVTLNTKLVYTGSLFSWFPVTLIPVAASLLGIVLGLVTRTARKKNVL